MSLRSNINSSYKKFVAKLSASNNPLYFFFYRYLYQPSRGSLNEFTANYSKVFRPITVVQVGANDGINNDPIHKFIKIDHWQGVLLEPLPDVFQKQLKPLYRNTPGIQVLNAALDHTDGYKPIYRIKFTDARWATGLTSFNRSVLETAMENGYIESNARKDGIELPASREDWIGEEKVRCISIHSLKNEFHLNKIDWLQVDTEGFDYEIIKYFNIPINQPSVVVYENKHLSAEDQKACTELLKDNDYACRDFGANTLAMKKPLGAFEKYFREPEEN